MGIVFAQPSPMAPEIAAGGGAAEVATHDFAALAGLYESANRNQLQASQAGAGLALQSSEASARNRTQADIASEQMAHANRALDLSRQPSDRDNYLAQVQAGAQQQHAQLQAWLQGQELSQAESMRLQRMQNAIGDVQARDDLDDPTKNDLIMQLKTGIDPLRQRQEASKAKFEQAQMQKIMHADAQEEARRAEGNAFAAKNAPSGVLYRDDNGNIVPESFAGMKHPYLRNHQGEWKPMEAAKAAAEKPEKPWDAVHEQKQAEAEAEMLVKKANPTFDMKATDEGSKDLVNNVRTLATQIYHERRQDYQNRGQSQAPQGGPGNTPPTTGQPGAAPQAGPPTAQQAAPVPPPADLKPFDWTKPETMHPLQKQQINSLTATRDDISARRDIPEKERWAAEDALTDAKELLGRFGSFAAMPEAEKKKFAAAKKVVLSLPSKPVASNNAASYSRQQEAALGLLAR